MANEIGLNVVERDVPDSPKVSAPPIGQLGAIYEAPRGPIGVAVEMDGEPDFRRHFWGAHKDFNSWYEMNGLWQSAGVGGAKVFGVRVGAQAAQAAQPARVNSSADPPYNITPGQTTILTVDANPLATHTWAAAPAQHDATGVTYPITAAGETVSFKINGGTTLTASLGSGSKTLADVLQALNAATPNPPPAGQGYSAIPNSGQVRLKSDKQGSGATVEVLASAGATLIGFTAGVSTGSGDAADIAATTRAEVKTALEATVDDLAVNLTSNGRFQLEATVEGPSGQIVVGAGTANTALGLSPGTTNGTAATSGGPTVAAKTFNRSATPVWTFEAGWRGLQSPGAWANEANGGLAVEIKAAAADPARRDVFIYERKPGNAAFEPPEVFENVAADNVLQKINHEKRGSVRARVLIVGGDTGVPDITNGPVFVSTGTPGTDGVDPILTDYVNALAALKGLPIQFVANLDLDTPAWATQLEAYCVTRGRVAGWIQGLRDATIDELKDDFGSILKQKSFLLGIREYLLVSDQFGGTKWIPALGHAIGAYVREARAAGDRAHVSPAGPSRVLQGVDDVNFGLYEAPDLKKLVKEAGFNPIVKERGRGFFMKTSRTFSTLTKHYSAHVRFLTNHILAAIQNNFGEFEQGPNLPEDRARLQFGLNRFMLSLDNQNAFEKRGGFDNNVQVICSDANNDDVSIAQSQMRASVKFRPAQIAEEVLVEVIQTQDGLLASDS
jgi:hypothetical protein